MIERNQETQEESSLQMPEMCEGIFDESGVRQLFRDVETCTDLLAVIPKRAPRERVGEAEITLQEGQTLLLRGELRAVQLRYRYQRAEWWDTLMPVKEGYKLLRVRHDFM